MTDRTYSIDIHPLPSDDQLDTQLELLGEEVDSLLSHYAAQVSIEKVAAGSAQARRNTHVATLRIFSLIGSDGIVDNYVRVAAMKTPFLVRRESLPT